MPELIAKGAFKRLILVSHDICFLALSHIFDALAAYTVLVCTDGVFAE